jgi:ribosomal protein S18 acetylase RimI-like enzyme
LISLATISDISALNTLVNSAYRGESSRKGWTTEADFLDGTRIFPDELKKLILQPGSSILTYRDEGGTIRGCVNIQENETEMYLGLLSVEPQRQDSGIGKKLIAAAEQSAREKGKKSMKMTVVSIRSELIAWYVRNGYEDTGERQPFPTGDPRFGIPLKKLEFIVMKKSLLPDCS